MGGSSPNPQTLPRLVVHRTATPTRGVDSRTSTPHALGTPISSMLEDIDSFWPEASSMGISSLLSPFARTPIGYVHPFWEDKVSSREGGRKKGG